MEKAKPKIIKWNTKKSVYDLIIKHVGNINSRPMFDKPAYFWLLARVDCTRIEIDKCECEAEFVPANGIRFFNSAGEESFLPPENIYNASDLKELIRL